MNDISRMNNQKETINKRHSFEMRKLGDELEHDIKSTREKNEKEVHRIRKDYNVQIEKEKNERDIFDMAGSGFESTVRLAKSSPAMWTPIFEQNKENVVETLEEYIQNLTEFKQLLLNDEFEKVYQEMDNTNRIKEILKGIPVGNTK